MTTTAKPLTTTRKDIRALLGSDDVKKSVAAVAGSVMNAERLCKLMLVAVNKSPNLAKCDPYSVLGAFMAAASLGLEPNSPLGHAYLIPYGKRGKNPSTGQWEVIGYECQFQLGYKGLIHIAANTAKINIVAGAIHEGDLFEYLQGSESFLKYRINLGVERGKLIGAFAYSKLENGTEVATVLPLAEIHKARERSETYKSLKQKLDNATTQKDKDKAQKNYDETPWVAFEDDMSIKTVIKKHCKALPMGSGSSQLAAAVELDNANDRGKPINMGAFASAETAANFHDGILDSHIDDQTTEDLPEADESEVMPAQEQATAKQTDVKAEKPAATANRNRSSAVLDGTAKEVKSQPVAQEQLLPEATDAEFGAE